MKTVITFSLYPVVSHSVQMVMILHFMYQDDGKGKLLYAVLIKQNFLIAASFVICSHFEKSRTWCK